MSTMSVFAALAAGDAIAQAGLSGEQVRGGRLGVSIGSTIGSPRTTQAFFDDFRTDNSVDRMKSGVFFHIMNHSCAANVVHMFGITGRTRGPRGGMLHRVPGRGHGAEMISMGKQDFMLCGGADEFHPLTAGTFDIMNAASTRFNEFRKGLRALSTGTATAWYAPKEWYTPSRVAGFGASAERGNPGRDRRFRLDFRSGKHRESERREHRALHAPGAALRRHRSGGH
jgi:3-oxoacyl-(acyl-carrier-protein) synthase